MSNTETSGFEPYEYGNLDESDDYVLIKQRQLRTRIVIGLIVVPAG